MLIALLAGFEALRKARTWSAAIACGIAFAIPTLILRTIYPAPIAQWAWWDTFKMNVPFIVWDPGVIAKSLRDNLKVLLFFNLTLYWAWRAWRRTRGLIRRLPCPYARLLCRPGLDGGVYPRIAAHAALHNPRHSPRRGRA